MIEAHARGASEFPKCTRMSREAHMRTRVYMPLHTTHMYDARTHRHTQAAHVLEQERSEPRTTSKA